MGLFNNKDIDASVANLKAQHGALYAEVLTEARVGMAAEVEKAKADAYALGVSEGSLKAATAENSRIMSVYERFEPGFTKEIKDMMADGKTTGSEAGDKLHMAGKVKRDAAYQNMQKEGATALGSDHEAELKALEDAKKKADKENAGDFKALVEDYQKVNKCSKGAAIAAIAKSDPEAHQKYVESLPRSKK